MFYLIIKIILFLSLIGMIVIVVRKIPVLVELPEVNRKPILKECWGKIKKEIKNFSHLRYFSWEIFIQKILSKIRIIVLRIENKIAALLGKLREKSLKKKIDFSENYWQELKKSKNHQETPR